jgi:hypothetical protein
MTELAVEKVSQVDLEPTWEEIECIAQDEALWQDLDFKNHSDWVDFCCMIENTMRRERSLI